MRLEIDGITSDRRRSADGAQLARRQSEHLSRTPVASWRRAFDPADCLADPAQEGLDQRKLVAEPQAPVTAIGGPGR